MSEHVTRRTFLAQSAAIGSLGTVADVAGAAMPDKTLEDRAKPFNYAGMNMHVVGFANRRAASLLALERTAVVRRALEKAGFHIGLQSVGGTGTYNIDADVEGVTEIQPGSYLFMDAHYHSIGGLDSEVFSDFGNSLTVLTTVISHPSAGRA